MILRTRRFIYLFFILLFFLIAPFLIFSTSGYRYNFKKNRVEAYGNFILDSRPKEAEIYLNNQLYKDKTPARVNNLLPGNYHLKFIKKGYYSWEKTLNIKSKQSTFANILLFKKNNPLLVSSRKIEEIWTSPDDRNIVYSLNNKEKKEFWIFNLENNKENLFYQTPLKQTINLQWQEQGRKILIQQGKRYFIISPHQEIGKNIIDLLEISDLRFEKIKWDEKNDDLLYGLINNHLYQINLFTKQTELIARFPLKINDFSVKTKNIYYLFSNALLKKKRPLIGETNIEETVVDLPSSRYVFLRQYREPENLLALIDEKKENLLIIQPESKTSLVQAKAKNIIWQKEKILYGNDFEIYAYDFNRKKESLITRHSKKIGEALWHPQLEHIFFLTDNQVKIIENDERDVRNTIDLVKFNKIQKIILDSKGKTLFFTGTINNQEGIYKLEI